MSTTQATITEVYADGFVTVQIPGKPDPVRVAAVRSISAALLGDQVLLTSEGARYWATALLGVEPPPPPPPIEERPPAPDEGAPEPPPEEQTTITGTDTCPVTWSGSYRNGGWRPDTQDVISGDWSGTGVQRGAAFYGRKPSSLGTLKSGRVRIGRERGGYFAARQLTMLLLAGKSRPSGFPSVLASVAGPSLPVDVVPTTWTLPAGWLDDLESGAAGGIGTGNGSATPYIVVNGPRMTLTLDWERTS